MTNPNDESRTIASAVSVAAASALYFALHSLLASFAAKRTFERWAGKRTRNGWYRALYCLSSSVGLAALYRFARARPSYEFYHARGTSRLVLMAVQMLGLALAFDSARRMRVLRLLGAQNLEKWAQGEEGEPEPEAQGPPPEVLAATARGQAPTLERAGAFAMSRNALNFAVLPLFWAYPRLNSNYAAFCSVMTLYCILGSWLTERRLHACYGKQWEQYKSSGVPFFLPRVLLSDFRPSKTRKPSSQDDESSIA